MLWTDAILSRSGLASMLSGLLEGMGIPWPGAFVLAAAGTEARDAATAVVLALCFGVVYTGSAWLQYLMGRYAWRFIRRYIPRSQRERLYDLMQRYGELAVLWTRPLAVGNYVSLAAGVTRMHQGKFLLYTFIGIMPWSLAMTFGGTLISAYLKSATPILTTTAVVMAVIGGLVGIRKVVRARQALKAESQADSFAD